MTLHLWSVPSAAVPPALLRMGLDRRPLQRTSGLRFWKLLGTGDGRTFTLRDANLHRWGLLAVWDDDDALAEFEHRSATAAAWRRLADERWCAELRPVRSHGSWAGRQPFGAGPGRHEGGPVAAITRARLRPRQALAFWRAVPPVAAAANAHPGLLFGVGIGEAPLGLQATFSVWRSERDLVDYAWRSQAHRHAIDETARRRWYAEELFARFSVLRTEGTVDGSDPLATTTRA